MKFYATLWDRDLSNNNIGGTIPSNFPSTISTSKPINKSSLLAKFVDEDDTEFQNDKFKLIYHIVEVWNAQSIRTLVAYLYQFFL